MKRHLAIAIIFAALLPTFSSGQEYVNTPVEISKEKVKVDGKICYSHIVLEKQTLYSICKAYGVSIDDIYRFNPTVKETGLKKNSIIIIPSAEALTASDPKFADIKKGMTITIGASRDSKYASLVLCEESVSGSVTGISSDSHTVEIDGKEYKLALNSSGSPKLSVTIGDKGTYLLDADGRLTAEGEAIESDEKYAYIAKAGTNGTSISNSMMLLAAQFGSGTKIVKTTGGTEVISYRYENSKSRRAYLLGNSRRFAS